MLCYNLVEQSINESPRDMKQLWLNCACGRNAFFEKTLVSLNAALAKLKCKYGSVSPLQNLYFLWFFLYFNVFALIFENVSVMRLHSKLKNQQNIRWTFALDLKMPINLSSDSFGLIIFKRAPPCKVAFFKVKICRFRAFAPAQDNNL